MDPRVLAEKKGLVIARIEAGLDMLVSKGFAGAHADELRAAVAARNEPLLNEFKRLAVIADLIDDLAMEMVERLAGQSDPLLASPIRRTRIGEGLASEERAGLRPAPIKGKV